MTPCVPPAALEPTLVVEVGPSMPVATFPAPGEEFLGFRLLALLGTGATSKVFLAREAAVGDRAVALKITTRPTAEPHRLGRLRHPHVVPVYSVWDAPPLQALCMPYLGRRTLADWLTWQETPPAGRIAPVTLTDADTAVTEWPPELWADRCPFPDDRSPVAVLTANLRMLGQLARGLAHAHAHAVLHLDIKPANVLLSDEGQVLLLDFNLSQDKGDLKHMVGGTLSYMAPEQLTAYAHGLAPAISERTDLFSLGVVAYELLTGVHPYPTAKPTLNLKECAAARHEPPPDPGLLNPAVPKSLARLVLDLLRPDPDDRPASATLLAGRLDEEQARRPRPWPQTRLGAWASRLRTHAPGWPRR